MSNPKTSTPLHHLKSPHSIAVCCHSRDFIDRLLTFIVAEHLAYVESTGESLPFTIVTRSPDHQHILTTGGR